MTKRRIYHTTSDFTIHKGHSRSCAACKRKKAADARREASKTTGRKGGKKRAANPSDPKAAPRTCASCGTKIDRKNKSGLCISCFNKQRAAKNRKPDSPRRECSTEGCKNILNPANQTGLCIKCFMKSSQWSQRRKSHGEWVSSAIRTRGPSETSDAS